MVYTLQTDSLSRRQAFSFALIGVPIGMTINAFLFLMPAYYAKHTSVTLAAIAGALMIARCVEIASDPLIGHLSDRTRTRMGSRKPWILAGMLLAPIAAYFVYHPPTDASWRYFLMWSGLTYFSWGIINIPALAWGTDLGRTYQERSRLYTAFGIACAIGTIVFSAIPLLPAFKGAEISARTVGVIGWTIALVHPLMLLPALVLTNKGQPYVGEMVSTLATLRALRTNKPLWRLLLCYALGCLAAGHIVSCWFFYTDVYLGAGALFPVTLLAFYLGNAVALPAWLKIMLAIGKHRAWAISWAASGTIALCLPHVSAGGNLFSVLLVLFVCYGALAGVELAAPAAILADVIDYDTWRSGSNKSGNYNALLVVVQKASIALGSAAGYLLLDVYGYDVKGAHNGPHANFGFLLTLVYIPTTLYVLAAVGLWNFPINRARHAIIRKRLDARALRPPRALASV